MAAKTSAQVSFTWTAAVTEDTFDWSDTAVGGGGGGGGGTGPNLQSFGKPQFTMITNLDATAANIIYVRFDGTAAVAAADGTIAIPANQYRVIHHFGRQLRLIAAAGTPVVNVTRVTSPNTSVVIP